MRGHTWSLEGQGELLVRELGTGMPKLRRAGVEVNLEIAGRPVGCYLTEFSTPPRAFLLPAWNFWPPSEGEGRGRFAQPFLREIH